MKLEKKLICVCGGRLSILRKPLNSHPDNEGMKYCGTCRRMYCYTSGDLLGEQIESDSWIMLPDGTLMQIDEAVETSDEISIVGGVATLSNHELVERTPERRQREHDAAARRRAARRKARGE